MGYTHYWNINGPLDDDKWLEFAQRCQSVVEAAWLSNINIARDYDTPNEIPEFSSDYVWFNGVEDEGHETFAIKRAGGRDFCKTARKPYDAAVVACLMEGHRMFGDDLTWSSDGDGEPEQLEGALRLLHIVEAA